MSLKLRQRSPRLPLVLQRLSNDEYTPRLHYPKNLQAVAQMLEHGPEAAARLSLPLADYWSGRQGTAAALHAVNAAWGGGFYNVPAEAALDREAADSALGGDQLVIDVQTHYVSDRPGAEVVAAEPIIKFGETVAGDLFKGLDKVGTDQIKAGYSFAEYLRCIFLESDNAIAILTSGPGEDPDHPDRNLNNNEMVGTRELIERLGGTGRLINHSTVHPNAPGDIEMMDRWQDWCVPAGWKCYTLHGNQGGIQMMRSSLPAWTLDDEEYGQPFLRRAMETGIRTVAVHKGLSGGADPGWDGPSSPKEIGPIAKAFPGINFLVYHSGYEPREGQAEEGPYSEEVSHYGTNRLIKSLKDAGIGPGDNVYAELGSTWYLIMAHPREAAHVLGKLLSTLGEDNILWGSDCIWYGPTLPLIDTFRAFQIPQEYTERYGYPQLTPAIKEKILGLNAARIYGIDPVQARERAKNDGLAWVKAALKEYSAKGTPSRS